jgi:hypothetical protein
LEPRSRTFAHAERPYAYYRTLLRAGLKLLVRLLGAARPDAMDKWSQGLGSATLQMRDPHRRQFEPKVTMAEETLLFALQPLEHSQPLVWCIVRVGTEAEARRAAREQSPDHLQVDWLAPTKVECRRVVQTGGAPPPTGTVSYFYEGADISAT